MVSSYSKGVRSWPGRTSSPLFPNLLMQIIPETGHHLTITLVSTRLRTTCPTCFGRAAVFLIHARRFPCPNPACPSRTFQEALSGELVLTISHGQRGAATVRFLVDPEAHHLLALLPDCEVKTVVAGFASIRAC